MFQIKTDNILFKILNLTEDTTNTNGYYTFGNIYRKPDVYNNMA